MGELCVVCWDVGVLLIVVVVDKCVVEVVGLVLELEI